MQRQQINTKKLEFKIFPREIFLNVGNICEHGHNNEREIFRIYMPVIKLAHKHAK